MIASSRVTRFVLLCVTLCVMNPVAAQETMDETTLQGRIIAAEGKPPASYVETRRITMSNGREFATRTFHRGLDWSTDGSGRFGGRVWDQDANGLTTIHESPSGLERPDARKVSITRVSQPLDAWKYEVLNAGGTGTIEYVDAKTYRVVREDKITHNGTVETDNDDFRTLDGFTFSAHAQIDDQISGVLTQSRLISLEMRAVTDAELAIPPSRKFVTFPAEQMQVDLPAEFIDSKDTQMSYFGVRQQGQDPGIVAVILRADIGGRLVDLALDSGAGSIVLDRSVVRDLGLKTYGQQSVISAGRYTTASAVVPRLHVGSLEMRDVVVTSLPFTYDANRETKVVGLLGYDFIRSVGLTIDYARRKVTAMSPGNITPPVMTPNSDILPIRLGDHVPMVAARINGSIAERMIVDTGFSGDMALFDYFSRRYPEAVAPRVAARVDSPWLLVGVGGSIPTKRYRLARVDLGRYHFAQFDASQVADPKIYEYAADGLIGTAILRHYTVTFDYAGGKMYLVHNEGQ